MAEYVIREDKSIELIQIAKKSDDGFSYWNNYLREWKKNNWTAFDAITGLSDELYLPATEEEVNEIVARYPKEA